MVSPRLHMVLIMLVPVHFMIPGTTSSGSLIIPPQSIGILQDSPDSGRDSSISNINRTPISPQKRGPSQSVGDGAFEDTEYGARGGLPLKTADIPPPGSHFAKGDERPILKNNNYFEGKEDRISTEPEQGHNQYVPASSRIRPIKPILPQRDPLSLHSNNKQPAPNQRHYEPYIGEGYVDAGPQGVPYNNQRNIIPEFDEGLKDPLPRGTLSPLRRPRIDTQKDPPYSSAKEPQKVLPPGPKYPPSSDKDYLHQRANQLDYPHYHNDKPAKSNSYPSSPVSHKPDSFALPSFPSTSGRNAFDVGQGNKSNDSPLPPLPFSFGKDLKIEQDFPFQSPLVFKSPRPFQERRAIRPTTGDSLLGGFSTSLDNFVSPALPAARAPKTLPVRNQNLQSQSAAGGQRYHPPANGFPFNSPPSRFASNPHPTSPSHYQIPYTGSHASGQCFQYAFPAEAYRLSSDAKYYPKEAIQKEINSKPHLAPLVGMEAEKQAFSPFSFNPPITSQFGYGGFGFENDANPSEKYSYLQNVKSYPGNLKSSAFVGEQLVSMQPLNSACPATKHNLQSFFHHGGDCFVVNPAFQDITYYRCTRRDCNFCGVNRGLSACVETYRWTTVIAYCTRLKEMSRIVPLRLILPTSCTCQHFTC